MDWNLLLSKLSKKCYTLYKFKSYILKEELTKLIYERLTEPSCSEWSSPIVLVPKYNRKWKMCTDYRGFNVDTIKYSYFLLNIYKVFDGLDESRIFTAIDLYSGYYQKLWKKKALK